MKRCALLLVLVLVAGGCARKHRRAQLPPPPRGTPGATPAPAGDSLYGYASWYGHPYHGRPTASGEIYNMYDLTAAHRTMPFGTRVKVINLENGRLVRVRINDRGPFAEGRIIDLSYAAAKAIQMVGPGTALVGLSVLETAGAASPAPSGRYSVQVGAFRERHRADRLRRELARRHAPVSVCREGDLYRVLVGAETTSAAANSLAERLRREHLLGVVVLVP